MKFKMSFLDEIRKQPRHHREIMFGFCVITTVSIIGMVWYNSFQHNLYTLLNPEDTTEQRYLANTKSVPSLLGSMGQTAQDLKAAFLNIFSLTGNDKKDLPTGQAGTVIKSTKVNEPVRVYMLPISEEK